MEKLIASRYGQALFQVGLEEDKLEVFYRELEFVNKLFKDELDLVRLLNHPKLALWEKKEFIDKIFSKDLSQEMVNFLYILIDKNRIDSLEDILDRYRDFYFEEKNIVRIKATSSLALDEDRFNRLKKSLEESLKKEVILDNIVDEDILGGIVLDFDGKVIDKSLRTQLDEFRKLFGQARL